MILEIIFWVVIGLIVLFDAWFLITVLIIGLLWQPKFRKGQKVKILFSESRKNYRIGDVCKIISVGGFGKNYFVYNKKRKSDSDWIDGSCFQEEDLQRAK